jgi:hypothetical protein
VKLQKIRFGQKVNVLTATEIAAWVLALPAVAALALALAQFVETGTAHAGVAIAAAFGCGVVFFLWGRSKTLPKSQYVITRILTVDETGTKATRVQVRYRDGSLEEMNFAK